MKHITGAAFLVCLVGLGHIARAQASNSWIEVSPSGEYFRVLMPHQPKQDSLGTLKSGYGQWLSAGRVLEVKVKSYHASAADGAHYSVSVLTHSDSSGVPRGDTDACLDEAAEIIWEGLLKSERDKLPDDRRATAAMTYVKELPAKPLPGREYTLTIGRLTGTAQFYVTESRIYVLLAMNATGADWVREPFFQSFAVAQDVPGQLPSVTALPDGLRIPHHDDVAAETIFRSSQVTARARVLSKPEPSYTESARKFSITGTVVLRCVFSKDGKITNLLVLRKLPHGLTQRAINAARGITFTPAVKDGNPVSMWMQLEYNFNLY